MNKIITGVRRIGRAIRNGSPYILTGVAVASIPITTVLAVKATPKAMKDLQVATAKKQIDTGDDQAKLTPVEVVKTAGPHYIPAGIAGLIGAFSMVGATKISAGRAAAAVTVATAAQQKLADYSAKVIEKVGAEKEQEIHDSLAVDSMRRYPPKQGCVIETGNGDHLFYYIPHHVWFRSSYEAIRQTVNEFNANLVQEGEGLSENTWLDMLYDGRDVHGEDYGFPAIDDNNRRGLLEIRFTEYQDEEGHPNPEYEPLYILNGEAATAIDLMPWCEPVYNWGY